VNLEEKAARWKSKADKLLINYKLESILKDHGKVEFTGSYKYNLMLSPDIDMYLIVKVGDQKPTAIKVLSELIEQNLWNGYLFYDWSKFRSEEHKNYPIGYYIGLKSTYKENRWKVDIWIVDEAEKNKRSWNDKLTHLNYEQREVVLTLKRAKLNGEIQSSVHDIYEAVLYKNVRTVNEFKGL
jgi:hypothetical protein